MPRSRLIGDGYKKQLIADNVTCEEYWKNGKYHREDGPAFILKRNSIVIYEEYHKDGQYHRENGPAITSNELHEGIITEEYFLNGLRHRDNGPAEIWYYAHGIVKMEKYWQNDQLHRQYGPAHIDFSPEGLATHAEDYNNGKFIREYNADELKTIQPYTEPLNKPVNRDMFVNVDHVDTHDIDFDPLSGGANPHRTYNNDGSYIDEYTDIVNGQLHREDGPAVEGYYANGNPQFKLYYQHDQLHREDGPAIEGYYANGALKYEEYFQNNDFYRAHGPTKILYYPNGIVKSELYYGKGGWWNRADGPAYILYDRKGNAIEATDGEYKGVKYNAEQLKTVQPYNALRNKPVNRAMFEEHVYDTPDIDFDPLSGGN